MEQFEDNPEDQSENPTHEIEVFAAKEQAQVEKLLEVLSVIPDARAEQLRADYAKKTNGVVETLREHIASPLFPETPGTTRETLTKDDTGNFSTEIKNKKYPVALDEISSDAVWGIHYQPEPSMEPTSYAVAKNLILIEEAQREIRSLINEQISERAGISILTEDALGRKFNEKAIEKNTPIDVGILSELLIREFLYRHQDETFSIERPTPADDFIFKFDFRLTAHTENDEYTHGVQITVGSGTSKVKDVNKNTRRWRSELEHLGVEDFQIFAFPDRAIYFKKAFNEWLKRGQPPGGPERFLDENTEELIMEKVKKIFVEPSKNSARVIRDHSGFSTEQIKIERRALDIVSGEELLDNIIRLRLAIKHNSKIIHPDDVLQDIEPSIEEKVDAFIEAITSSIDTRRAHGFLKQEPDKFSDAIKLFSKAKNWIKEFPELKAEIDKLRRKKYSRVVEK
jgi:hypothetical protein